MTVGNVVFNTSQVFYTPMKCTVDSEELLAFERLNELRARALGTLRSIIDDENLDDTEKVRRIRAILNGEVQV